MSHRHLKFNLSRTNSLLTTPLSPKHVPQILCSLINSHFPSWRPNTLTSSLMLLFPSCPTSGLLTKCINSSFKLYLESYHSHHSGLSHRHLLHGYCKSLLTDLLLSWLFSIYNSTRARMISLTISQIMPLPYSKTSNGFHVT